MSLKLIYILATDETTTKVPSIITRNNKTKWELPARRTKTTEKKRNIANRVFCVIKSGAIKLRAAAKREPKSTHSLNFKYSNRWEDIIQRALVIRTTLCFGEVLDEGEKGAEHFRGGDEERIGYFELRWARLLVECECTAAWRTFISTALQYFG